jgi:two-component system LytT family response regulator
MPDITGIEVIEKLSFKPNIIFTTAYEHFAIKAFDSFAVDYLLKPIKEERFDASIEKLSQFGKTNAQINIAELQQMIADLKPKSSAKALPIKIGEKILLLEFDSIAYMEANDKYVNVFTIDGHKYLVDFSLTLLEEKLPPDFLRVQKSYIINKLHIKEVHKHFNSRFVVTLKDKSGTKITTGLTYFEAMKDYLQL